jgi:hypothetical protein
MVGIWSALLIVGCASHYDAIPTGTAIVSEIGGINPSNTSVVGQSVTFSANTSALTLSQLGSNTIIGRFDFFDNGNRFFSAPAPWHLHFGGVEGAGTEATVTISTLSVGQHTIQAVYKGDFVLGDLLLGSDASLTFTVTSGSPAPTPAPTLTSINPTGGAQGNNVPVTLTGTNFVSGATVNFNGSGITAANVTVVSSTSITATLQISATAPLGPQNVSVATSGGTSQGNVTFTVTGGSPAITSQPGDLTVTAGDSASFSAAASGSPNPTVQWQVSTDSGATFSNVSGATSTTLTFVASPSENGNQYRAVFTNPLGTATTRAALLTVKPQFANGPIFTPGSIVALDDAGDTVVIGLSSSNTPSTATVFVKTAGTWSQAAQLQSPTGVQSVAISGDGKTVVIGDCGNNACTGQAYVYVGWAGAQSPVNPSATLTASNGAVHDRIGYSVATDQAGDTIAVGAPCDFTAGTTLCGTVYVYNRKTGWAGSPPEDAQLQIAGTAAGNATLGISVAMDSAGETIVAGQSGTGNANIPGAVYVFLKHGSWGTKTTPDATLTASTSATPVNGDALGTSLSISGDGTTIVAGSPFHPSCLPKPCGGAGPGAAYVFHTTTAGVWMTTQNEDATLTAQTGHNQDQFGASTAINFGGTTIVIAAPNDPFSSTPGPGADYVFQKNTVNGWSGSQNETQLLTAFSGTDISGNTVAPTGRFGGFGNGVSLSNNVNVLAIGGQATVNGTANKQAVWLFQ